MPTFAQTLNALAARLMPLLDTLSARTDPASVASAASLQSAINGLLTNAMNDNAAELESKLAPDATAAARLRAFTSQADAATARLARSEANVARFVSLADHVGQAVVAGASGNIGGCASGLLAACSDLDIHVG